MIKKTGLYLIGAMLVLMLGYVFSPMAEDDISHDYSQVILAKDSSIMRVFLNEEQQWCLPPQLQDSVPEKLQIATLTYEDQYFEYHPGINVFAIVRAIYLNIKQDRIVSGASTITMQLARMTHKRPRTLWNKVLEIFLAIKLEVQYSKQEILKSYLTHAPYGSNIRGYIAASYRFYGKAPKELTWSEAATLAVLPNAPSMVFPSKNDERLKSKRDFLLKKLHENNVIDSETYELSLLESVPNTIIPFPISAPHLTERIHQHDKSDIVYTSINPRLQYENNYFVKQHAGRMQQLGIENVCTLVVDNTTSRVVSYVGSQDFDDFQKRGRVDGIQAPRSSGSILKPFLYARCIDEGLILPQTLIKDVPTYFNSFSPRNASEKFSGIVPASVALIHSLNIPAVRLLNVFGVNRFYNELQAAGISTLFRKPDDYGLTLILGGAEVTPWDVAKLYVGMANGGEFKNISYLRSAPEGFKNNLISHGASHLVLEEMKELIRPGLEFYWKKYGNQKAISWKTGTSYGHKDAWAAGSTDRWTIVVWVGNFDGSSNNALSGMKSAGPLLFNILNALPDDNKKKWIGDEPDFVEVKICEQSGFYPNSDCPDVVLVNAPLNMKPIRTCPYHIKLHTDKNKEHEVCSRCWATGHSNTTLTKYPPDVTHYLRKNGALLDNIPTHNPACRTKQEQDMLQIIYPMAKANIFLPKDFDGNYQPLVARVASQHPDRELFWYLDESYLGSSVKKNSFPLQLKQGQHRLAVVDQNGNKDDVVFSVLKNQ